ncbi:MAG: LuxR C-terminal-related transcriptional regulator [Actinobacteria bacterium]|nr:LuxR C-terminal-related transcriptional regulator [Actinomycetota bacterium]
MEAARELARDVPAELTSFLGRDGELGALSSLLADARLVTLTGAPGIGKSRLGIRLGRHVVGRYADGVWLVELAPLADGGLLPVTVAATLSVQELPGCSVADALLAHLRKRRLLLVLDNCEHLLDPCAHLIDRLLAACPGLSILATSQEALTITGERVWRVQPLSLPGPGDPALPASLLRHSAVELFLERARAVQPGFVFDSEVAPAVAEICRRLDGMPLAIELAAARVGMIAPAEIAQRLDERFALLTTGGRGVLPRHQTLRAALDWSHGLLEAPAQALLGRLSVFLGRFSLEACEAICSDADLGPREVFDLLSHLVARSLVVAETVTAEHVRYRLLETVRAYGAERLEAAGETASLREAHARYYVALAERAEPELTGPGQEAWFRRLDSERENLRAALEWSVAHGRGEWALRLCGALVLFWRVRCHFSEGRDLLRDALAAGENERGALRARALWGAGFLTFMAGEAQEALPMLERSLAEFRELGDAQGTARALLILANARQCFASPDVLPLLAESTALARQAGDAWCLAHALGVAGIEHAIRGETPAARTHYEECLVVARQAGDKQGLRFGLMGLGQTAMDQGDYHLAQSALEEAVLITGELGESFGKAVGLKCLGELAFRRGEYHLARGLLGDAAKLLPEAAPSSHLIGLLALLSKVDHAQGRRHDARLRLEEMRERGDGQGILEMLGMAELAAEEGDAVAARRLFEGVRDEADAAKRAIASACHGLGRLARDAGDEMRAAALHHEALGLRRAVGDLPGIAASLEALAGLAAAGGRHAPAARLLGVAGALRARGGYARVPWERSGYESDVALIRRSLGDEAFEAAFTQGEELPLEEALRSAAKSTRRPGGPRRASELTRREQQVAELVADALTNAEIAERLFISPETVKTHVANILAKRGIGKRRELAREIRDRGRDQKAGR